MSNVHCEFVVSEHVLHCTLAEICLTRCHM